MAYKRKSAGLSGQWQGKERTWIVRGDSWKGFTAPVRAAAPSCIETEQTDDNNGQTAPSVTAVPQKLTCGWNYRGGGCHVQRPRRNLPFECPVPLQLSLDTASMQREQLSRVPRTRRHPSWGITSQTGEKNGVAVRDQQSIAETRWKEKHRQQIFYLYWWSCINGFSSRIFRASRFRSHHLAYKWTFRSKMQKI